MHDRPIWSYFIKNNVPISILEAIDLNIPIIASDIGGVSEIFQNQLYMRLTKNTVRAISQHLQSLITAISRAKAGEKEIRIEALQDFSWARCAKQHFEIYERSFA